MSRGQALRALCAVSLLHATARAEGAPNFERSNAYYRGNITGTLLRFGSSSVLDVIAPLSDRTGDFDWFPGDEARRGRVSHPADG